MKKKTKKLISAVSAAAVCLTSMPFSAFANNADTAEKVTVVGRYDLPIGDDLRDNEYWFRFEAPEDATYTFASADDDDVDLNCYIYKEDNYIDYVRRDEKYGSFSITLDMFKGDVYMIKVVNTGKNSAKDKLVITSEEMSVYKLYTNYSDKEGYITSGDVVYGENEDGTLFVYGAKKKSVSIEIPEKVNGKTVTAIGNSAFHGCNKLTSVKLSKNLKVIDDYAFMGCEALESIELPDGLEEIGFWAFKGCAKLKKLDLPDSVTELSSGSIEGAGINIEEDEYGVTYYQGRLLSVNAEKAKALKEYNVKPGTVSICRGAFTYCFNLEKVVIPESVVSIGDYAFGDPDTHTGDDGSNGLPYLKEVIIEGNGLKKIGYNAFVSASSLESVRLPDSLEEIGDYAFTYTGLQDIELPASLKKLGGSFSTTNINTCILPDGIESVGAMCFCGLNSIVIPATVKGISDYMVIQLMSALPQSDVDIYYLGTPEQLENAIELTQFGAMFDEEREKKIECANVHYNCKCVDKDGIVYIISDGSAILYKADKSIESVDIPAEIDGVPVVKIEAGAFKGCSKIKKIVVPDNIKSIGDDAFDGCSAVESITIPKGTELPAVTEKTPDSWIAAQNGVEDLFDRCTSLKAVEIGKDDPTFFTDNGCIYSKDPRKLIFVPENVGEMTILDGTVEIAMLAFEDVDLEEMPELPASVKKIGERAFEDCDFTNVVLPDNVEEIEDYAFAANTKLETIVLPKGLKTIPNNLFGACISLKYVEIPDSVEEMGNEVFWNCYSLKYVYIPESVQKIGYYIIGANDPDGEYSWSTTNLRNVVIVGHEGSKAEDYATTNYIRFIDRSEGMDFEFSEPKKSGDFTYIVKNGKEVIITGYTAAKNDAADNDEEEYKTIDVVVPAEIDGLKVTEIDTMAFYDNQ